MISIQSDDFDVGEEYEFLRRQHSSGAIVTFCGLVRDLDQDKNVDAIELEHYSGMTEKALQDIVTEAQNRWSIEAVKIIHRVGKLRANEQIVFVGVASAHRKQAFAACEFIMDYLKTRAPFWKKQFSGNDAYWVEAKSTDRDAAERWRDL